MEPLISVIIPVYNMEQYLARCLDSVTNNTYRNLEIICIDDGSKDRSLKILQDYEKRDGRIVVITKENGGVSSARNAGLDRMTGEYVSFIDPDDFVHPQYFELLLGVQMQRGTDIVACGYLRIEEDEPIPEMISVSVDGKDIGYLTCQQFFQNKDLRAYCWGRLFRGSRLKNLRFHENIRYAEDAVFEAELWEEHLDLTCSIIDAALYYYYQRSGSLANRSRERDRLIVEKLFVEKASLSVRNEQVYLEQAIRRLLNSRYYAKHFFPDDFVVQEIKKVFPDVLHSLRRTTQLSGSEKLRYRAFIRVPGAYWMYRVLADPGMWKWERWERKKRRAAKKNRGIA